MQKDLLHAIISKITENTGNRPYKRSVNEIELFFDASIKNDFVPYFMLRFPLII
jgi:site-specific DNA recombinase